MHLSMHCRCCRIVYDILPLPGGSIALVPAFVGALIVLFVWKRVIKKD